MIGGHSLDDAHNLNQGTEDFFRLLDQIISVARSHIEKEWPEGLDSGSFWSVTPVINILVAQGFLNNTASSVRDLITVLTEIKERGRSVIEGHPALSVEDTQRLSLFVDTLRDKAAKMWEDENDEDD